MYMFFGFVLVMIILIGIAFLRALFGVHPATGTQNSRRVTEEAPAQREEDQTEKDIREDSEGDGLMMDDPMFPPEFDDDDDI